MTRSINTTKPTMPTRKWWQYIPGLGQGYEDKLARYQNLYNEWMWNQQNKYNSPASQVSRYREAGLSPALMYGQGDAGNAEMGRAAERPEVKDTSGLLSNTLGRFMDTSMKVAQIKDTNATARLKNTQADDLQKEMSAKDTYWTGKGGAPIDWSKMSARERSHWAKSQYELRQLEQQLYKTKGTKAQAEIMEKINNIKNIMLIMQLATGGLGAIARFK